MWQMDGEKVTCGTQGGLVSKWKQSMKLVVTTNDEKSADAIVNRWLQTSAKGRTLGDTSNESNRM